MVAVAEKRELRHALESEKRKAEVFVEREEEGEGFVDVAAQKMENEIPMAMEFGRRR